MMGSISKVEDESGDAAWFEGELGTVSVERLLLQVLLERGGVGTQRLGSDALQIEAHVHRCCTEVAHHHDDAIAVGRDEASAEECAVGVGDIDVDALEARTYEKAVVAEHPKRGVGFVGTFARKTLALFYRFRICRKAKAHLVGA